MHVRACMDSVRGCCCTPLLLLLHAPSLAVQRVAWCLGGAGTFLLVRKAASQRQAWAEIPRVSGFKERVRKALEHGLDPDAAVAAGLDAASGGDAAAGGGGSSGAGVLVQAEKPRVCVVCLSAPSEMVYVRCGHMCCCSGCSQAMTAKRVSGVPVRGAGHQSVQDVAGARRSTCGHLVLLVLYFPTGALCALLTSLSLKVSLMSV